MGAARNDRPAEALPRNRFSHFLTVALMEFEQRQDVPTSSFKKMAAVEVRSATSDPADLRFLVEMLALAAAWRPGTIPPRVDAV